MQLFQGANKPQQPAETQSSSGEGGGLSLPSVSLPSVGLPSLPEFSGLNVTPSDALDVRTVALPGPTLFQCRKMRQQSMHVKIGAVPTRPSPVVARHAELAISPVIDGALAGPSCSCMGGLRLQPCAHCIQTSVRHGIDPTFFQSYFGCAASVLGIAALGYVSYKYDAGFRSMIREGMVKVRHVCKPNTPAVCLQLEMYWHSHSNVLARGAGVVQLKA